MICQGQRNKIGVLGHRCKLVEGQDGEIVPSIFFIQNAMVFFCYLCNKRIFNLNFNTLTTIYDQRKQYGKIY